MSSLLTAIDVETTKSLSSVLGWTYFLCWSLSFYPQPYLNHVKKSTYGLSIDFPTMNLLGFAAYTISTAAFMWSSTIKEQYARRHAKSPETTVRFNDFAFGAHAFVMCAVIYSQFFPKVWGYHVSRNQKASRVVRAIVIGSLLAIILSIILASVPFDNVSLRIEWLDVVYIFGFVKLVCTLCKYTPQAYLNYQRKSTVGWSIHQILLDFAGGILSILQLLIDCSLQADWSGLTGNPVKLGLANTSLFFDVIFMTQHYVLYRERQQLPLEPDAERLGEHDPLL